MAKSNYAYARYQRDLARKRKQEEKRLRKTATRKQGTPEVPPSPSADEPTTV